MKASAVAKIVATLLATDAKPTEAAILAAILAEDKKGKDELPEMKAKDEKEEKAEDEKDDKAEDEKDCAKDDESEIDGMDGENEVKPGMPKTSPKAAEDTHAIVAAAIRANDALHAAKRAVETTLGAVNFDSAEKTYKAALDKLGVATDGVHASAYGALFAMARDKQTVTAAPSLATDASTVKDMAAEIPGYDRI